MRAPLPCWQQRQKDFRRQSRAQQTLGKSPSERFPCARLHPQLLLQHLPVIPWEGAGEGSWFTFPAPAGWDPCAVPPPAPLPTSAPLQGSAAGSQTLGCWQSPQSHLRLCHSVSPAPNSAFLSEAKRSGVAAGRGCFVPVRSRGGCADAIPDPAGGEWRSSGAVLPSGGSNVRHIGPARRALSPHRSLRSEEPKVPDWDTAPQGTLPLPRLSVSRWPPPLRAHGRCFP